MLSSVIYNKLQTRPIKKTNKEVNRKDLVDTMRYTYTHCSFSTIPYLKHKIFSSNVTLQKYNSGNCIAMCMFAKKYIQKKYNITSFIIPATIPVRYQRPGYLDISHVALCVPKNNKGYYILDLAFYFMKPIFIYNNNLQKKRYGKNKNIYNNNTIEKFAFSSSVLSENLILNTFQTIPKDIIACTLHYVKDIYDTWTYFIIEATNPDESIGETFLSCNIPTFITVTDHLANLLLYIKMPSNNTVYIKYRQTEIYNGLIDNIEKNIVNKLDVIFKPFFPKGILDVLKK
jgi:hypothetical protein